MRHKNMLLGTKILFHFGDIFLGKCSTMCLCCFCTIQKSLNSVRHLSPLIFSIQLQWLFLQRSLLCLLMAGNKWASCTWWSGHSRCSPPSSRSAYPKPRRSASRLCSDKHIYPQPFETNTLHHPVTAAAWRTHTHTPTKNCTVIQMTMTQWLGLHLV